MIIISENMMHFNIQNVSWFLLYHTFCSKNVCQGLNTQEGFWHVEEHLLSDTI
jgi:hypothetical protein